MLFTQYTTNKRDQHQRPQQDSKPRYTSKRTAAFLCRLRPRWSQNAHTIQVCTYLKRDKTDRINYRGISVLPATCKILSTVLLSRLTPYAEEIIGYNQCGFRRNLSATDHIFGIHNNTREKMGIQRSSA